MSHSVMLYEVTRRPFDVEEIAVAFERLATGAIRRGSATPSVAFDYGDGDGTLEVRLDEECGAIWIEGFGPTAMSAAVELRGALGRDVMLADDGYEFDLLLDGSLSSDALLERVLEAMRA